MRYLLLASLVLAAAGAADSVVIGSQVGADSKPFCGS